MSKVKKSVEKALESFGYEIGDVNEERGLVVGKGNEVSSKVFDVKMLNKIKFEVDEDGDYSNETLDDLTEATVLDIEDYF